MFSNIELLFESREPTDINITQQAKLETPTKYNPVNPLVEQIKQDFEDDLDLWPYVLQESQPALAGTLQKLLNKPAGEASKASIVSTHNTEQVLLTSPQRGDMFIVKNHSPNGQETTWNLVRKDNANEDSYETIMNVKIIAGYSTLAAASENQSIRSDEQPDINNCENQEVRVLCEQIKMDIPDEATQSADLTKHKQDTNIISQYTERDKLDSKVKQNSHKIIKKVIVRKHQSTEIVLGDVKKRCPNTASKATIVSTNNTEQVLCTSPQRGDMFIVKNHSPNGQETKWNLVRKDNANEDSNETIINVEINAGYPTLAAVSKNQNCENQEVRILCEEIKMIPDEATQSADLTNHKQDTNIISQYTGRDKLDTKVKENSHKIIKKVIVRKHQSTEIVLGDVKKRNPSKCSSMCEFDCCTKFTEEDRQRISKEFARLKKREQNNLIKCLVKRQFLSRPNHRLAKYSYIYNMPSLNGQEHQVCAMFFMTTLDI